MASFKRIIGDELLAELNETKSADPSYLEVKAKLDAVLDVKKPAWADALKQTPISVKCWLETDHRLHLEAREAEEFYSALVKFAQGLDNERGAEDDTRDRHLPLLVDIGALDMTQLPITPAIADRVQAVNDFKRVRLNCRSMAIDPSLVTCSRKQLRLFLQAVTNGVTDGVMIDLLPFGSDFQETIPLDDDDNADSLIRDLIVAIATCERVDTLHLGGLLEMFETPRRRAHIYLAFIEVMLVRPKPTRLVLSRANVGEVDAGFVSVFAEHWKTLNPQGKLKLKGLKIGLNDEDHVFTNALLAAVDEVEELSIDYHDFAATPISNDQTVGILTKFQTLRRLSLANVDLESMHVFEDALPPVLHSISLRALRLDDRQSLLEFFGDLAKPELAIAQQLRHFEILTYSSDDAPAALRLQELEVDYLAYALQNNRVLEHVRVFLDLRNDFHEFWLQDRLLREAGSSTIPAASDVRRTSDEKARRVAFLSVLRHVQSHTRQRERPVLDTFLIRQVFAFSDPWTPRTIHSR